jgi:glycosyltransferase involved in cell wall biosynthesis
LDYDELAAFLTREAPNPRRAAVCVIPFRIPGSLLPGLYRAADAFVVPARGEGWGMPYGEAMACGVPTIATRWGGQLEFMDDNNAFLVDVERTSPIDEWMQWATGAEPDHLWVEPSVDHLREIMRWVFEHRAAARRTGETAREHMVENFTWKHAAERICERLEGLGEFTDREASASRRRSAEGIRAI